MSSDSQYIIPQIDGPLCNYLFIPSPIGYHHFSSYKSVWQLIKSNLLICLYIIYISKASILLGCDISNTKLLIYLGDTFQVFENTIPYSNYTIILMHTNAFLIYLLFHLSSEHDLKWFSVIRILKGYENLKNLNLTKINTLKRFILRVEFIICKVITKFCLVCISITVISFGYLLFKFQSKHNLVFYFINPWRITDLIMIYSFIGGRYVVYSYYYLICYKIKLELIDLKNEINSVLSVSSPTISLSNRTIEKLLSQLAKIHISINCYNRFWKKYLWFAVCTSVPAHAFLLFSLISPSIKPNTFELICTLNEFLECNMITLFIFYPLFKIKTHFKSLYKSYYKLLMLGSILTHPKYEKV